VTTEWRKYDEHWQHRYAFPGCPVYCGSSWLGVNPIIKTSNLNSTLVFMYANISPYSTKEEYLKWLDLWTHLYRNVTINSQNARLFTRREHIITAAKKYSPNQYEEKFNDKIIRTIVSYRQIDREELRRFANKLINMRILYKNIVRNNVSTTVHSNAL
jgi:hypothetical protein